MEVDFEKAEARLKFAPEKVLLDEAMRTIRNSGLKTGLKEPLVSVASSRKLEVRAQISGTEIAAAKSGRLTVTIRALGKEDGFVRKGDWSIRVELQAPVGLGFPAESSEEPRARVTLTSGRENAREETLSVDILADAKVSAGTIQTLKAEVWVHLKSGDQRNPEKLEVSVPVPIAGGK